MTVAIDFDRTIHDIDHPVLGRVMGPPLPGAKDALIDLKHKRHTIIIHSCRGDERGIIRDWMTFYEIPYHEITNVKPVADIYIDDKGWRFTNWSDESLRKALGIA